MIYKVLYLPYLHWIINMNEKGYCILLQLCLFVMSTSCLSGSKRTDQPSCPRGNYTLKATNIMCEKYNKYTLCTWLLGTQDGNSSAIDTSCNYISKDESVKTFFALHDPFIHNGYKSWRPCRDRRVRRRVRRVRRVRRCNRCALFTRVTDPLYLMVTLNNNILKSCKAITIEQVEIMNKQLFTEADEFHETDLTTARAKQPKKILTLDEENEIKVVLSRYMFCGALVTFLFLVLTVMILQTLRKRMDDWPSPEHSFDRVVNKRKQRQVNKRNQRSRKQKYKKLRSSEATWTNCINMQSVYLASKLLQDNVLPTNAELQLICNYFGKRSLTKENVCEKICKTIVTVLKLKQSTNVWPALSLSNNKIVFVVESEMKWLNTRVSDFEIQVVNSDNTLEKESQIVMLREKEILALSYDTFGDRKFKKLQQVISKNAKRLMNKHKSINVITPGVAKSIGYLISGQHKLVESPCISIFVNKKVRNLIPLGEEPIPSKIDGFPTDVLEGKFDFFSNGPNDYQQSLKIGCGIHAGVMTGGTIGAFVKHKTFDLCCITSAHVVLSREELRLSKRNGYIEFANREERKVCQPFSELSEEFGKLVAVSYTEGCLGSPGVEVALIQVQQRKPISGAFPHVASAGSGHVEQFAYDSGNVIDASLIRPYAEVYKFGMATKSTTGYLGQQGVAINDRNYGVRLYNQLSILPKHSSFAENGDSGALVFTGHPRSTAAIGILEGRLPNGSILVSPIIDVLEELKCPLYLYRFGQDSDAGINVDFPVRAEEGNIEENMDVTD